MTEPGTDVTSEASHALASEDESDAWRDDIALITPSGAGQWLSMPIVFFVFGAGGITGLELITHGRGFTIQGWTLFAAALVLGAWAFPLAWFGRRADNLYNLEVSQNYVRLKVRGLSYLCWVVTFAGIVSASILISLFGLALLFIMWSKREVRQFGPEPSEFRRSLARIVERAVLVEGILMAVTSLTCALLAYFLPNDGSQLASWYIGGGVVFFIVGAITTTMSLRGLAKRRSAPPLWG